MRVNQAAHEARGQLTRHVLFGDAVDPSLRGVELCHVNVSAQSVADNRTEILVFITPKITNRGALPCQAL